jgi:hypothetical protein
MRLLNTETFTFREFLGENIPPYAILSHRWEEEEVTFGDLNDGNGPGLAGYSKILGLCAQAKKDSLNWAWIDTCYIDKSSSAELSEAINSMFKWYRNGSVCYAYLSDVPDGMCEVHETEGNHSFNSSQWFKRGWTLQELLAPKAVRFYDTAWKFLGTREILQPILSKITGVNDFEGFKNASIAQKMCWMADRKTTRIEDIAYCMLGLFDVYMPLLYGEGEKAFYRLQLELLKTYQDDSLLAWSFNDEVEKACSATLSAMMGPFATSPSCFRLSGDIVPFPFDKRRPPLTMTSKGLFFEGTGILKQRSAETDHVSTHWVALNCGKAGSRKPVMINLNELNENEYKRVPEVGGCEFYSELGPLGSTLFNVAVVASIILAAHPAPGLWVHNKITYVKFYIR